MNKVNTNRPSESKLETFLTNKFTAISAIVIFFLAYLFQRFFPTLDEAFISKILRLEPLRFLLDPFWLIMYWGTVAIFFLSITVYFVFANKRAIALAMLAIVVLGGLFLGDALKTLFALNRPPQSFSAWAEAFLSGFIPTTAETNDFPAQSVLVPAAFCTYFYLRNPKKWKAIAFPIYVILMFFARPYIGVNHISANIAGTVLGIYIGVIVFKYTPKIRDLQIFDKEIYKLLVAIAIFTLMFIIYWLQRPLFVSQPSQGVDLDIRMFFIVCGGFIGLSISEYPKELKFFLKTINEKVKFVLSILISYIILFALYLGSLTLPTSLIWIGIIIGFIDGLWIAIGGPYLVEYINKNTIE